MPVAPLYAQADPPGHPPRGTGSPTPPQPAPRPMRCTHPLSPRPQRLPSWYPASRRAAGSILYDLSVNSATSARYRKPPGIAAAKNRSASQTGMWAFKIRASKVNQPKMLEPDPP